MSLAALSDEQLLAGIREHGSNVKFATSQGMSEWSVRQELRRRGLTKSSDRPTTTSRRGALPTVTRESLHRALQPPNNCKVKAFLDLLDQDSRRVVEEALGYSNKDFNAGAVRDWLVGLGFRPDDVPGSDAINDHRAGRRPCRCRG